MPRGKTIKSNVHSWSVIGPQFAQITERNNQLLLLLPKLLQVSTGEIPHIYSGLCPDGMEGFKTRDPDCEACKILCEAENIITKNNMPHEVDQKA